MDRHLEVLQVDRTTLRTYRGYVDNHVLPLLGKLSVGRVNGEVLNSCYPSCARAGPLPWPAADRPPHPEGP
jgi:hypothetical protein